MRRLIMIGSGVALLVALVMLLTAPAPPQIYAGTPFVYPARINLVQRAPWILLALVLWAAWVFGRGIWQPMNALTPLALTLLSIACCVSTLLPPVLAWNQLARHQQSVRYDGRVYHLYYQLQGLRTPAPCEHVLVRCDAAGLVCEYVERWQVSPVCLADNAPIRLRATDEALEVIINNDIVGSYPEDSP